MFLDWLADHIGVAGLTAAAPGVVAALDQHMAAVRDILAYGVPTAALGVLLTGYGRGVLDQALEYGWQPHPEHWDWVRLRLAAVCSLSVSGAASAAGPGAYPES